MRNESESRRGASETQAPPRLELDSAITGTPQFAENPGPEALPSDQVLQSLSNAAEVADTPEILAADRKQEEDLAREFVETIGAAVTKFDRERTKLLDLRIADLVDTVDRLSREVLDLSAQLQIVRCDGETTWLEFEAARRSRELDDTPDVSLKENRAEGTSSPAIVDVRAEELNGREAVKSRRDAVRPAPTKRAKSASEHLL